MAVKSQRDPNKKLIGGFYDKKLHGLLEREAKRRDRSMSTVILELLVEALIARNADIPAEVLIDYHGKLPPALRAKVRSLPPKPPKKRRSPEEMAKARLHHA